VIASSKIIHRVILHPHLSHPFQHATSSHTPIFHNEKDNGIVRFVNGGGLRPSYQEIVAS